MPIDSLKIKIIDEAIATVTIIETKLFYEVYLDRTTIAMAARICVLLAGMMPFCTFYLIGVENYQPTYFA